MNKKFFIILFVFLLTLFTLLFLIGCPSDVTTNPGTTTTTTTIPQEYQGVYLVKFPAASPPNPDKITITPTKMTWEKHDGSKYYLYNEGSISLNNNILTVNITKIGDASGQVNTLPCIIDSNSSTTIYLNSIVNKVKLVETEINGKKCFYINYIFNGGDTTPDLSGDWSYKEYSNEITIKQEIKIGTQTLIFYSYDYRKMPEIKFTSNKMLFHGYKYWMENSSDPNTRWIWYEFDVTADCAIDMNSKIISLSNIKVSNNLPAGLTLTEGKDYPAEGSSLFEIVNNNYFGYSWDNNDPLFYLEKQ